MTTACRTDHCACVAGGELGIALSGGGARGLAQVGVWLNGGRLDMKAIWMRLSVAGALGFAPVPSPADAGRAATPLPGVVLYKSEQCGCCGRWAEHLRAAGFRVIIRNVGSLTTIEDRYGVPKGLTSCHTALAGGYLVVGHIPADLVQRLLTERQPVAGVSAPGMPQSAPGMDGSTRDHYDVVAFDREGHTRLYATR